MPPDDPTATPKRRGWTVEQAREAGRKGAAVANARRRAGLGPKDGKPRKGRGKAPDLDAAAEARRIADAAGAPAESRPRDEPPAKGAARLRTRTKSATTKAIADALAEILSMPAVPCAVLGDDWAAQHFTVQGREFADRIAATSERNAVLRRWCERALEGESVAVLLMGSILYAYPPLMHWGILPGPAGLFGVPDRPERRRRQPIVTPPPAPPPATVGDGLAPEFGMEVAPELFPPPPPGNGGGPVGPDDLADVSVHMLEDEPPAEASW